MNHGNVSMGSMGQTLSFNIVNMVQVSKDFGGIQPSWILGWHLVLPSGKQPHNYGKSPFLIGKTSINGPFSIATLNNQRVTHVMSPDLCCAGQSRLQLPALGFASLLGASWRAHEGLLAGRVPRGTKRDARPWVLQGFMMGYGFKHQRNGVEPSNF